MSPEHVFAAVYEVTGHTRTALCGSRRTRDLSRARALVAWALRQGSNPLSFPRIGALLNKDHSSVQHAMKHLPGWLVDDREFREAWLTFRGVVGLETHDRFDHLANAWARHKLPADVAGQLPPEALDALAELLREVAA